MGFLPFWPPLPTGSPDDPGGGDGSGLSSDPDAVRVAAVPSADPTDEGYTDQQPGAYGDPVACRVSDRRATRLAAGLAPSGVEDYLITSLTPLGVTQANQGILWIKNAFGNLDDPLVLRSTGKEVPPNDSPVSGNQLWTVYATGRD